MNLDAFEPRLLTVTRGDAGVRLDLVLRRHLAGLSGASRTLVQAWMAGGRVRINGIPVRRASTRAAVGDEVQIMVPPQAARQRVVAEELPLRVVYEDDHLLAVDKPAGLVVHPTYKHPRGTLLNGLLWRARQWPAGCRPSLVNRLDRLTSGIVLVAKTERVHAQLQRAMHTGSIDKTYLAMVYGRVRDTHGRIDLPLGRDSLDVRRVVVRADGAPSTTCFDRIGSVAAPRSGLSLLRCRLVTGRMHQIRVHLTAKGWPLVGDAVYGEPLWRQIVDPQLATALGALPRQALHAWRVTVPHPVSNARLVIEAPVPDDLVNLLTLGNFLSVWRAADARGER